MLSVTGHNGACDTRVHPMHGVKLFFTTPVLVPIFFDKSNSRSETATTNQVTSSDAAISKSLQMPHGDSNVRRVIVRERAATIPSRGRARAALRNDS